MNPFPLAEPACAADAGSWCARFWQWTDSDLLARSADAIVSHTVETVAILVVALLTRYVVHRAISRLIDGVTSRRLSRFVRHRSAISEGAKLYLLRQCLVDSKGSCIRFTMRGIPVWNYAVWQQFESFPHGF